jgi:cobalt-zinc-cadmium resistance protein CzcA
MNEKDHSILNNIIAFSLNNRLLVIVLFAVCVGAGIRAMQLISVDAFPDTTPVQVQINTNAPALDPTEIEQQLTLTVELAISGLPGLTNVRSVSKFGFSQIVATFDDDTHIYDARQLILERLGSVELPEGIERPQLGPISTGLGEVFHYLVRSDNPDRMLDDLRTLHDWVVKPELRKVTGVAEINSWGGFERQYHVIVSPEKLVKYYLTFDDVFKALEQNNQNVGGGQVVSSGQAMLVHGIGRVTTIEQIEDIVIKAEQGVPVHIRDIATVAIGHEIRRGAVSARGEGEVVLGLGFMLMGENSKDVTQKLRDRIQAVRQALPDDIILEVVYDRIELVDEVILTVTHNLVFGAILVIVVLFILLGNLRAGLLVAVTIPFAMLFAFLGMYELSIAASLLSLGAIDFGVVIDGSVVMTENNLRRLAEKERTLGRSLNRLERFETILTSSKEVVRPIVFGMGIILIVFIPILSLESIEGKMFRPMAWTFIFAMVGALLCALALNPILSYYFLPRRGQEKESRIMQALHTGYSRILTWVFLRRKILFGSVGFVLAITVFIGMRLGGEFVPRLSEGAIVINTIRLAGVDINESVSYNSRIEALLMERFPVEIKHIWSRIGSAEVTTDPMGTELTDIFIALHPRDEWQHAHSQAELVQKMTAVVDDLPGLNMVFTQPIEMRMNEMVAGIRSDVGIKIFGDDFDELVRLSDEIQRILLTIPGAVDISGEQITGQPKLQISVDQDKIARHGIPARNVLDVIEAVGVRRVGEIFEGQRRFPLAVRLPDAQRTDSEALRNTLIPGENGILLPLRMLAEVKETEGPATVNREWGRRLIKVQCNVGERDVASFVAEAQARIAKEVDLPEGYVIEWGGQFEHLIRSRERFMILVPLTLAFIFLLLYFSLRRLREVLIIYTGIPFAAVGGIFALWLRGIPFSVSAAVGFIALSGIAVLNGQVLVAAIRKFRDKGLPVAEAVLSAAKQRLRPVLATAITDAAGFIPMAISTGVGAEVQRPLATVVIGGVITSTLLTLLVLPMIYGWFEEKAEPVEAE